MKKVNFVPIGDLGNLTEEQRVEYYNNVCQYLEIPPELHLLKYHWFDSGDGAKKLILYGGKAFADFMRDKRKIETDSLEETFVNGVVMFKCKGHDQSGRHEIAVGAASIEGLRGKKLEDNIAKAQTRAIRRLTLQFVGAGILDETELDSGVSTDIVSSSVPLSVLAQPTVQVNRGKGKDITKEFTSEMKQTEFGFIKG